MPKNLDADAEAFRQPTYPPSLRTALGRRLAPVLLLVAVYVGIGALLRIALEAGPAAAELGVLGLLPALLAGLANDTIVAVALATPFALWQLLPAARDPFARRPVFTAALAVAVFLGLYLAVMEYYFFEEFNARFNLVAFDYLMYPTEVAGDVWQEYPVVRVVLLAAVASALLVFRLRHRLLAPRPPMPLQARGGFALAWIALVVLLASTWRTDALALSGNRAWNELAQNGASSFLRAALTSEIEYGDFYARGDRQRNIALLEHELTRDGSVLVRAGDGTLLRRHAAKPGGLGRLNVVLVSSESFGAEFSRLHGSAKDLTPNFDRYARQGLWFANTYASGTRTVRGLEALAASFPPIPTVSILRRPHNEGVATWGAVMQQLGYSTSFLYGGYGYFDNMNHFFGSNGFEVLDRTDIRDVRFENIWGVSDEDLFDRALEYYDERSRTGQPFFSIIMTTSNHKPFTFRPGLESIGVPEEGGGREAGVRYADHALGYFLDQAARHAWFKDTLFVVVADHGARVYGRAEIPLKTYEIPLMVYAPGHVAPRQVDALMTQIDVAPTVLGLLGLPYEAPFFGVDALSGGAAGRVALFNHNHDVAAYRDGTLAVLGLHRHVSYYHYDRAKDEYAPAPPDEQLRDLAIAYFETASDLFHERRYRPASADARTQMATQAVARRRVSM